MPLRRTSWCLLLLALIGTACASPVGVDPADPRDVRADRLRNVLSDGSLSASSSIVLQQQGLDEQWEAQPDAALDALREGVLASPDRVDRLAALAELSFLRAEQTSSTEHYLASVVYAWLVLFPSDAAFALSPLDGRLRFAAELYNSALAQALLPPGRNDLRQLAPQQNLPFGSVAVSLDPDDLVWARHHFTSFAHADEFRVRGLRNRHLRPGLGAPLVGLLDATGDAPRVHVSRRVHVPATLVLRLDDAEAQLASGAFTGELSLYAMDETRWVSIDGKRIPLEYESSVALASSLEGSAIWSNETSGLLRGDFRADEEQTNGLLLVRPYHPGRIPLVLVHGTASSPGRWADIVNELWATPDLGEHYQVWLFIYPSGNPIAYSAMNLRNALRETVAFLDPEGKDPALRHMVIAGHSQGGLLSRLLVVDSGDHLWRGIAGDTRLEDMDLAEETKRELAQILFFEAYPGVTRAIFLSTPHRGSRLVQPRVSGLASRLIGFPSDIAGLGQDLLGDPDRRLRTELEQPPTSIENMRPGSDFMVALEKMPVEIPHHTIIGVQGDGPRESGDDGVVNYTSAHLETADSELVVDWGHSLQAHPDVIQEMLRLLAEHLERSSAALGKGEEGG